MAKAYIDLYSLPEDDRITIIGKTSKDNPGKSIAFTTDSGIDDYDKADRYIRKLKEKFPEIEVISREAGPVANVVTIKVRHK